MCTWFCATLGSGDSSLGFAQPSHITLTHAASLQAEDEEREEGGRGKRAAEKHAERQTKRARLEAAQGKPRRQVAPSAATIPFAADRLMNKSLYCVCLMNKSLYCVCRWICA